jgi:hypothetical protein
MINRSKRDDWYFTRTREGFLASAHGISRLLESKCGDVVIHAQSLDLSIGTIVLAIIPNFFLPYTTLPVTLTLFDSFVFEGRKILTRVFIGIITKCRSKLLKATTARDFLTIIMDRIEQLESVAHLKDMLKTSFKIGLSRQRHMSAAERHAIRHHVGPAPPSSALVSTFFRDHAQRRAANVIGSMPTPRLSFPASDIEVDARPQVAGGRYLTREAFLMLREYFPGIYRRLGARVVYQMSEHGTAISTFFERAQPGQPHILVIRTETSVFGAVLGDAPVRRKGRQGWFGSASHSC